MILITDANIVFSALIDPDCIIPDYAVALHINLSSSFSKNFSYNPQPPSKGERPK